MKENLFKVVLNSCKQIMKKTILLTFVFITNLILCQEDIKSDTSVSSIDNYYIDFSIPKVTAFSLLNIEPSNILKPGTVKELVLGLGGYFDSKGNYKSGLAMEWAPLMTFNKAKTNWEDMFQWKNLLFSMATNEDSLGGNLSMAFRWSPIDLTNPLQNQKGKSEINSIISKYRTKNSDQLDTSFTLFNKFYNDWVLHFPTNLDTLNSMGTKINITYTSTRDKIIDSLKLMEYKTCTACISIKYKQLFTNEIKSKLPNLVLNADTLLLLSNLAANLVIAYIEDGIEVSKRYTNEIIKFKSDFKKENWNKMAFEIGGGQILSSSNSNLRDLSANYNTFYLSFAMPLSRKLNPENKFENFWRNNSQIMFQLKNQMYYTPDSTQNNSLFIGTRFLAGKYNWNFSVECSYNYQTSAVTNLNQSYLQYALGGEYQVGEGNWIALALGGATVLNNTGRVDLELLPRISFRHAFQKESRLK